MADEQIAVDDPRKPDVRALLERHLEFALGQTPPEHSFALDLEGLLDPAITLFSFRAHGILLGVGAIKCLTRTMPRSSRCTPARPRGAAGSGGPC